VICDRYDVAVVPFPFTDRAATKRRPVVALSSDHDFGGIIGQTVFAMITQAARSEWPFDHIIDDFHSAGLTKTSVVRMKLFTLDNRLIIRRIGTLSVADRSSVERAFLGMVGHQLPAENIPGR
jgi:mRNA interferase MazF